jgi:glycosyltransferase involved in cell wall biosynthesis
VLHACYRDSYSQSAVVSSMLVLHRWAKTWQQKVAVYLVATEFYRQKSIEGGLPADKIVVKPHFLIADPGPRLRQGDYALFVGRLAAEKGVRCLLAAWKDLSHIPLKIRGDGPLADEVKEFARSSTGNVEVIPRLPREQLYGLIKGARFLIWPSEGLYETFGLVAIEAFACGVPILTSGSGAMQEIVEDGRTGLHFHPGDPVDLRAKAEWAWEHHSELQDIGRAGRAEFEAKYRSDCNYEVLIDVYRRALRQKVSLPR